MNLDIGILWIEDSFSPEEETALRRRILDAGFSPRIKNEINTENIEEIGIDNKLFHRFEIILLDYKLKNEYGDAVAPHIRALFPSTTILFYSGTVDEGQLRKMIAEKEVEGVFCSRRAEFIEKAGALIDQTAHTLNRLSGMRGLSMRVVSECDELMLSCIRLLMEKDQACHDFLKILDSDVIEHLDGMRQRYEAAMAGSFDDRIETRAIDAPRFSSSSDVLLKRWESGQPNLV